MLLAVAYCLAGAVRHKHCSCSETNKVRPLDTRGAVPDQPVDGAIPGQSWEGPWAHPKRSRITIGQSICSHCVSWDNLGTAPEHSQDDPCAILGRSYGNSETATVDSGSDQ